MWSYHKIGQRLSAATQCQNQNIIRHQTFGYTITYSCVVCLCQVKNHTHLQIFYWPHTEIKSCTLFKKNFPSSDEQLQCTTTACLWTHNLSTLFMHEMMPSRPQVAACMPIFLLWYEILSSTTYLKFKVYLLCTGQRKTWHYGFSTIFIA